VALIVAAWLSLFLIRITAPPDLLDKDQERPAAYMLDAALNGHWIVQRDDFQALPGYEARSVCSKPPVYTWCGALLVLLFGRINAWCLYLPTAAALLGSCLLVWGYGRRYFGPLAGLLAGTVLLWYYHGVQARNPFVVQTVGLRTLAADLEARFGTPPPLLFADTPYTLQFFLGTMRPRVSLADAARRLAGNLPVMVAVKERHELDNALPADARLHEIARWPASGPALVTVVSNRDASAWIKPPVR